MAVEKFFTKPITLLQPVLGAPDAYGQPTITRVEVPIMAYVRPLYTDDANSLVGQVIMDTLQVWCHRDTVVADDWFVVIDGLDYEIVGEINKQWNPREERIEYVEFKARRRVL